MRLAPSIAVKGLDTLPLPCIWIARSIGARRTSLTKSLSASHSKGMLDDARETVKRHENVDQPAKARHHPGGLRHADIADMRTANAGTAHRKSPSHPSARTTVICCAALSVINCSACSRSIQNGALHEQFENN